MGLLLLLRRRGPWHRDHLQEIRLDSGLRVHEVEDLLLQDRVWRVRGLVGWGSCRGDAAQPRTPLQLYSVEK